MDIPRFQFVFQGGGAKLVALIAAAHAVRDFASGEKPRLAISRISGTSAGSIAAALLATGEDPKVIRTHMIAMCDKHLDQIITQRSLFRNMIRSARGKDIYNIVAYRNFLLDLFKFGRSEADASYQHLRELTAKTPLFIHSVDIETGREKIYDGSDDEHTIVNALHASSAIPFFLHTPNWGTKVDGGVLNNLPVNKLLADRSTFGEVVAFSFAKPLVNNTKSFKEYVLALVGTVTDYSVEQARASLDEIYVCPMQTEIGTLDFSKALEDLKKQDSYGFYRSQAEKYLSAMLVKHEERILIKKATDAVKGRESENVENVLKQMVQLHATLRRNSSYSVERVVTRYTCKGLAANNSNVRDEVRVISDIKLENSDMHAFGFSLLSDDNIFQEINKLKPRVQRLNNHDGERLELPMIFPIPNRFSKSNEDYMNVLLFFNKPLSHQNDARYRIEFDSDISEVLFELGTVARVDHVFYRLKEAVKNNEVWIVCDIPEWLDPPQLVELYEERRPRDCCWRNGERLKSETIIRELGAPQGDFKPIGWRVKNMVRGEVCGFSARLPTFKVA